MLAGRSALQHCTRMSLTSVKSGRARAIDAALEVLRSRGIGAVTMRSVADAAGMTAPALYWHYQDKDALLRDIRREVTAVYRNHVLDGLREEAGLAGLRVVLTAFRTFALAEPNFYEVLFLMPPVPGSLSRPSGLFQILVERVRECMRDNALEEGDPADLALTITAHAQGLVMLHRRGQFDSPETFGAFFDRSVDRLILGIVQR